MTLHGILLVLFCHFCCPIYASASNAEDSPRTAAIAGHSAPLAGLPEAINRINLGESHATASFTAEPALEIGAIAAALAFAAFTSHIGCNALDLFTVALFLVAILYERSVILVIPHTTLIHKATSASVSLARFAPTWQAAISSLNGTVDLSRAAALFLIIIQRYFNEIAAQTIAFSVSRILAASISTGFIQLGLSYAAMLFWARGMQAPIPSPS